MINLHERLSEFSYGYGVTREVEKLLAPTGLHATPFFPSLRQEGELGFDVGFETCGCVVLFQFKLGQELQRFRRQEPQQLAPSLEPPFWRLSIKKPVNQFKHLLNFEKQGANVVYVAPRFSCWTDYKSVFRGNQVLDKSILLIPSEIERGRLAQGEKVSDRVVYDRTRSYICSEPIELHEETRGGLKRKIEECVRTHDSSLKSNIEHLFEYVLTEYEIIEEGDSRVSTSQLLDFIGSVAPPSVYDMARIIGFVALNLGAQLVFVTEAVT